MVNRRDILKGVSLGAIASAMPGLSFAKADTDARFVLVILRGAADGLAIAAPYGDGNYRKVRGELALPEPGKPDGLLKLDGLFGLNPALAGVHSEYEAGRAAVIHAIASPYRERSHFDGQDVLENGGAQVGSLRDGWLNRAVAPLGGSLGNEAAIAMAQNTPLVLRGENSVTSWAPSQLPDADESTLRRLQDLYADDEFFATRLAQALKSQEIAESNEDMDAMRRRGNDAQHVLEMMRAAAKFLTSPGGPQIAVLEAGGWDTHANQGTTGGALFNQLAGLDAGLMALKDGLGKAWSDTVVAVVTEFGRTVAGNGTGGTDHGTASAAILLGGAVRGGRAIADWPGLGPRDLHEGRDLMPTTDLRSLFKGILLEHLHLEEAFVDRTVFPRSASAAPLRAIIRS
jgi:uncharacterized protein (DUF1501 family)